MTRGYWLAGAALVLTSSVVLAQRAPESILPPTPAPTATPSPTETPPADPTPDGSDAPVRPAPRAPVQVEVTEDVFAGIPSARELERMTSEELDELFGLKPKFDIPPAAQRSTDRIGVIAAREGGFAPASLARQPASIVRAALGAMDGPVVSRWGHILLRRALASRLEAPESMSDIEFAALRAATLNAMGEHGVARALVQDVDTNNYDAALTTAALGAYVGTADIVGACPIVRSGTTESDSLRWAMFEGICSAYAGETTSAQNDLRRVQSRAPEDERIDALLAQRYAGAAGQSRRAVTIEWDGVTQLNPWRFAMANALGEPIPDALTEDLGGYYLKSAAVTPALTVTQRLNGAETAAQAGILSADAMVDLYSQLYANRQEETDSVWLTLATRLRDAYVNPLPSQRLAAIRDVWDGSDAEYGRRVLTAYAAARLTPSENYAADAADLIASMLTAGLERDALRWADVVEDGSEAWALLQLADPASDVRVSDGDMSDFVGDHSEAKSRMLLAGLAGLGRMSDGDVAEYSDRLSVSFTAPTAWTRMIDQAAAANNAALVAILAGLGMQGDEWDEMTARHLYHIVSALARVGLEAEARMIAAEAVARA